MNQQFGYDTGKNDGGQSFREESRLPDGTVKGAYGYIDAEGKQRIVKYTAGIEGFKVESDEAAPGSASAQPASRSYAPTRQMASAPASYQLPAASQTQSLGGYNPVSATPRYTPQQPLPVAAPQPAPVQYQVPPQPTPATYQARAPSPLPNYSAALQAQLAAVQASGALQNSQATPATYRPQTISQQLPSYSATLAQRQPTLSQARPAHLASIPRTASAAFGTLSEPLQESTTWGPPVINKELLSYNIGVGRR